MNKEELIKSVADELGWKYKDADQIINRVLFKITDSLIKGENVNLRGFATFTLKEQKERNFHNAVTGQTETLAARTKVKVTMAEKVMEQIEVARKQG